MVRWSPVDVAHTKPSCRMQTFPFINLSQRRRFRLGRPCCVDCLDSASLLLVMLYCIFSSLS